ncbi:MAG: 1,4-alpha-glucan branching protein GlgB [Gemmatimonadota bacterium]|nr:MAG: 1,4-alpha-glucan branching protein GlgB [Gemmatimonadota bacterium]
MEELTRGMCAAPFDLLGIHPVTSADRPGRVVRAFLPWARQASVLREGAECPMRRAGKSGLFEATFPAEATFFPYRFRILSAAGQEVIVDDPYRFPPVLDEARLERFNRGEEIRISDFLGARLRVHEDVAGASFAVWAPHAHNVNLLADFNGWDGRCHPMRPRGTTGIWELFVPGVTAGTIYKYEVRTIDGQRLEKADPVGFAMELRPATASIVVDLGTYEWADAEWLRRRGERQRPEAPISVYEVHLGSWRRPEGSAGGEGTRSWLSYRELADELLPYVADMGYSHVELLPVSEHPLDESWGYQTVGYFAPTSRFGAPDDFRHFVDRAHKLGIGVILDWVPAHFPTDGPGLIYFDGTHLYEHGDPRQGIHPDWGTAIFDYGRPQVRSFLVSSALFWIEQYHIDGLRVDAVASMLYLDYSREAGQWVPNVHGGKENLDAISFLRRLNDILHAEQPDVLTIAEESTAWPKVSHPGWEGGLGFDMKWNMGWMHDTLAVMGKDPVYRRWMYNQLTFSMLYAFTERFLLPFSHDEVVHLKRSLISKMPGEAADKFAGLRLLLGYQYAHPGKKLLFMGGEFGVWEEWRSDRTLDWELLEWDTHRGLQQLVRDLNRIYREEPALHEADFSPEGFEWIDCHDADRTTLSFVRWAAGWREAVVVAANFTPVAWEHFRLAVPWPGEYRLILNSDAPEYGGTGVLVSGTLEAVGESYLGRPAYLDFTLPPQAVLYFKPRTPGPTP